MTVTITTGQKAFVDERVRLGRFTSASEAVREGLRALERQETHLDDWMRQKIEESLNDPGPDIPESDVFAELRERNASWTRIRGDGD